MWCVIYFMSQVQSSKSWFLDFRFCFGNLAKEQRVSIEVNRSYLRAICEPLSFWLHQGRLPNDALSFKISRNIATLQHYHLQPTSLCLVLAKQRDHSRYSNNRSSIKYLIELVFLIGSKDSSSPVLHTRVGSRQRATVQS